MVVLTIEVKDIESGVSVDTYSIWGKKCVVILVWVGDIRRGVRFMCNICPLQLSMYDDSP